MIEFDIMVTWRGEDDSEERLPATVCLRDTVDCPASRVHAAQVAIEANVLDFPEDVEDRLPVLIEIKGVK